MAAFGNNTFHHQSASILENNPSTVTYANPILSTNYSLQKISDTQTSPIERKRKASEQNSCNQMPIKMKSTQQFFCEVCNLQLNSLSQAAQHKQGKSHQINLKKYDIFDSQRNVSQENSSSGSSSVEGNIHGLFCEVSKETNGKAGISLQCIICSKNFNSNTQAGQHFNGQSHKRKLQSATVSNIASSCTSSSEVCISSLTQKPLENLTMQKLQEGKTSSLHHTVMGTNTSEVTLLSANKGINELYCEFCGLEANSKLQMQMHLQGTKHRNAVATSALLTACEGTKKAMFYCFQCQTNFNSQSQLEQHTSSQKHQKKVNLRHQTAGQSRLREMTWNCGHGQRGISGASRALVSCRGRGGSLVMVPAISTSFVTASSTGPHPSNSSGGWKNHCQNITAINSAV